MPSPSLYHRTMLTRSVGDEGVILQGKLVNIPDTDCIRVTGPAIKRRAKWHRICNLLGLCDLFFWYFWNNIWFDFIGNVENIVTITFLIISKLTQFSAKQNANVWNVPGLLIVSDLDEKKTHLTIQPLLLPVFRWSLKANWKELCSSFVSLLNANFWVLKNEKKRDEKFSLWNFIRKPEGTEKEEVRKK